MPLQRMRGTGHLRLQDTLRLVRLTTAQVLQHFLPLEAVFMRDKEIKFEVVFQDEWEKRLNELLA